MTKENLGILIRHIKGIVAALEKEKDEVTKK